MKKFKIDRKSSKRFGAFVLATIMIGSTAVGLSGCKKTKTKTSFLDNTILEDTQVIEFEDGHKDIVIVVDLGCSSDSCDCEQKIYKSIITNEYLTADICTSNKYCIWSGYDSTDYMLSHYNIVTTQGIISFLTTEEIVKASKNELTEDDISNIISRIFTKEEEQKNPQKVK